MMNPIDKENKRYSQKTMITNKKKYQVNRETDTSYNLKRL